MDATTTVIEADSSGRVLEVVAGSAEGGVPLLFHNGTPTGAVLDDGLVAACAAAGLRPVTWSRPGYGRSGRVPDRSVVDVAADAAAVLDALGADRFVTAGWSGGGPHALACAARLADRCAGAATIAGVAPYTGMGEAFFDGMAESNVAEFRGAVAASDEFDAALAEAAPAMATLSADDLAEGLDDLLSDADRAAIATPFREFVAASFRRGCESGPGGWYDDDLAFTRDWGFEVDEITVAVDVWHGRQDRMVPIGHGRWLAGHIPTATLHESDDGHISLPAARIHAIVEGLAGRLR